MDAENDRNPPPEGPEMFALIAIGVTVGLFALLNLIEYRRID
jgi:hypothetical protein